MPDSVFTCTAYRAHYLKLPKLRKLILQHWYTHAAGAPGSAQSRMGVAL
jgi:hypothetical protein